MPAVPTGTKSPLEGSPLRSTPSTSTSVQLATPFESWASHLPLPGPGQIEAAVGSARGPLL